MQASTFLEEKINQVGQGEEVVLLDMYLEERNDICLVPELDQEQVLGIFTQSKKVRDNLRDMMESLSNNVALLETVYRLDQLRDALLPLLMLTVEDGVFRYSLNQDEYVVEISRESALKILEHAFQLEGY
ncbi:Hypothetical protein BRZCDTV_255 [Brazilian cedratvirus IHUMI]|uniref:Uncharacterized protein n=1 Tax=Brazilian cedratvirus IHUMI TaxID=2126980 RepID=A0A2R8FE62_9VIRU|nr:Hypothetical protein BRZCDTV_255 [Brazilian cedratvirus IHUMI]